MAGGASSSNNSYYLYTGQYYWSLSPSRYNSDSALGFYVFSKGSLNVYYVDDKYGVRPSVSLAPGMMVVNGDGSSENPYEVMSEDEMYG